MRNFGESGYQFKEWCLRSVYHSWRVSCHAEAIPGRMIGNIYTYTHKIYTYIYTQIHALKRYTYSPIHTHKRYTYKHIHTQSHYKHKHTQIHTHLGHNKGVSHELYFVNMRSKKP